MRTRFLKNMILLSLVLPGILFITNSCVETEQVSPIPEIKFIDFSFFYATDSELEQTFLYGRLEFDFIDGDADLGAIYNDSASILQLIQYEKIDGVYHKVQITNPDFQEQNLFIIPHDYKMDRVGQNKTIKGIMRFDILFDKIPDIDTMKYEFFITDRANHLSNLESTADFSFKFEPQLPL